MVEIKIENNKIIVDGKETNASEWNKFKSYAISDGGDTENIFIFSKYPVLKEFAELGSDSGYFGSRLKSKDGKSADYYTTEEYLNQFKKNNETNRNLYNEIKRGREDKRCSLSDWSEIVTIWDTDNAERQKQTVKRGINWIKENLSWFEKMVVNMKQLKSQLENTGNDNPEEPYQDPNQWKDHEELKRRAQEIENYRQQVKSEIEEVLNQSPPITNEDLEPSNRNWQEQIWNTIIATGEKEIAQIRTRVLTDIRSKRAAKTGEEPVVTDNSELAIAKRDAIHDIDVARNAASLDNNDLDELNRDWREKVMAADNENTINLIKAKVLADIRNRREQKVDKQKEAGKAIVAKIHQATAEEITNLSEEQLQEAMELFTRWEGENDYQESPEKLKQIEDKLVRENFELYKETITKAIKERMNDYGLNKEELSTEVQVLVNGEITTSKELVAAKLKAIKEIGDLGAKSKWRSLFSSIKDYIQKAKKDFGSHLEEQLKIIKKQLTEAKNKATSNYYLTQEYKNNEAEFSKLERDLETVSQKSQKNDTTDSPVPKGVIIGVAIASGLVILGAIALAKRKKKS